jgi:hypothetical protein
LHRCRRCISTQWEIKPMIRRLLVPLLASDLLLAATAGSAFGKCEEGADPQPEFCSEVQVSLNVGGGTGAYQAGTPTSFALFQAGTSESFNLYVSLGEQPLDAMAVAVIFVKNGDTRVRVQATPASQPGQWTGEVQLPEDGFWAVTAQVVDANGAASLVTMTPIRVSQPAEPPTATPVTPPPAPPAAPALPIALLLAGIAIAAVAGQTIGYRSRRRTAGAPAPSGAASAASADRA